MLALALFPPWVAGQASPAGPDAAPPVQPSPGAAADLMRFVAKIATGGAPLEPGTPSAVAAGVEPGAAQVTPTEHGLLDVHARDLDIAALLEMLSYEARTNIVTSNRVTGRVSANLYGVTLEQALDAILTPNQLAFRRSGGTIFVGLPEEIAALQPPPETRVFRLRYIRPKEAAAALKSVLGDRATIMEGGGESETASSSGSSTLAAEMRSVATDYLIVTAHPAQLEMAERLLAELDQRPRQVLIESTVLRATLNESNQLGIDFTLLGGIDFQNVASTSNASADLTTGPLPAREFQDATFNMNTDFAGNVTGGGFTFGVISNNIAAFVRALEEVTDVAVVANPKVVALNKQQAEVIVGRRDGYLTTTVTETAAVQTVEFLETGTQIKFCPFINEDGSVRLSVHPKDSNGGLTAANLPFEETTEAHADILVNDGDTVLIGGLFRERTVNTRSQLPVLGNIPIAGLAFGSRNDQTIREEVIILLTVHVLKETDAERARNEALLDDVERIRVGSRMGLMGTGRERLAQAFYHAALADLERGHRDLALLNTRMTLHNQPKHMAAIKLKERLLDERIWDEEGTRMRSFVWDLIRNERTVPPEEAPPPYGRPATDGAPPPPLPTAEEGVSP
ncbi:MAG: secretin and TonB N-terminal domain-containing protein [Phycisphaerae bacterium]|nr:secretin and TonB N-terminal domain-containing protein [Phycisphaerae bacterium]